jgi:rieske iron-sulfur protein
MNEPVSAWCERLKRRSVLRASFRLGLGFVAWRAAAAAGPETPDAGPPQPGDRLVYMTGANKGQVIEAEALPVGGPQVLAYALDPKTNTVRSGSLLNQVLVLRLDPAELDDQTRSRAADGIVAYSAVCTHQGCPISMWKKDAGTLFCACHGSQFDPKRSAAVVAGPAPRRLAMLPLAIEDGVPVAAGGFTGRVGYK